MMMTTCIIGNMTKFMTRNYEYKRTEIIKVDRSGL